MVIKLPPPSSGHYVCYVDSLITVYHYVYHDCVTLTIIIMYGITINFVYYDNCYWIMLAVTYVCWLSLCVLCKLLLCWPSLFVTVLCLPWPCWLSLCVLCKLLLCWPSLSVTVLCLPWPCWLSLCVLCKLLLCWPSLSVTVLCLPWSCWLSLSVLCASVCIMVNVTVISIIWLCCVGQLSRVCLISL